MKKFFLILFLFNASLLSANENLRKFEFESTFPEGFGVLIKRELLLKKVKIGKVPDEGIDRIYVVVELENHTEELLLETSDDLLDNLNNEFGENNFLRIIGIGYESLTALGSPSLSESVRDEDIILPATHGWNVVKSFRLRSFNIFKK